jgi:hypothetical protein
MLSDAVIHGQATNASIQPSGPVTIEAATQEALAALQASFSNASLPRNLWGPYSTHSHHRHEWHLALGAPPQPELEQRLEARINGWWGVLWPLSYRAGYLHCRGIPCSANKLTAYRRATPHRRKHAR